jgi:hypothetical protein
MTYSAALGWVIPESERLRRIKHRSAYLRAVIQSRCGNAAWRVAKMVALPGFEPADQRDGQCRLVLSS